MLPGKPPKNFVKRPSPKGIQGSQYIVRKTPQGIEMITPEMLPKNMTTLMNQAASSWKTLEAVEARWSQRAFNNHWGWLGCSQILAEFLPSQLGSATSTPYSFNLCIEGLGTTKSLFARLISFPNYKLATLSKYTYHITHRHLTPFSKGNHALLNHTKSLWMSARFLSAQKPTRDMDPAALNRAAIYSYATLRQPMKCYS